MEWDTTRLLPDGRVHAGRDDVLAYWRDIAERWESLRIEADEWLSPNDEFVVMLGRLVGVAAQSGVAVEGDWHRVWQLMDAVPYRCGNFSDRDEALAAAGLPA
ncbi:MAG: hypothetical protein EXQ70_01980 [Solirubrobacterales bacterium]|nr:hypothetical protein [Solirubrobacterales bacterium]